MKTLEKDNVVTSNTPLTSTEKGHMALVQKAIDHGAYNSPKSKEERMRKVMKNMLDRIQ